MAAGGRSPGAADRAIGALIRQARTGRAVSQRDLAAGIGVRDSQIGKYEAGTNRVPAARLHDIAAYLDLPVERLFPPRPDD